MRLYYAPVRSAIGSTLSRDTRLGTVRRLRVAGELI
jgi:hypothetical protein